LLAFQSAANEKVNQTSNNTQNYTSALCLCFDSRK